MSRRISRALLGVVVSALAAVAVAPAHAATLTQTYSCAFPLISDQPLMVDVRAEGPSTWPAGTPTLPISVVVNGTAGSDGAGLGLLQAATIEGAANVSSTVTATGFDLPIRIPTVIERTALPAGSGRVEFVSRGSTPAVTFPSPGSARFEVDDLALNLRLRKADGTSIVMPSLPGVPDSDGDPTTFDVECTLDPPGQAELLYELTVVQDVVGPTKPSGLRIERVSDVTPTTAKISWDASTDDVGVSTYEVLVGEQVIVVPGNVTTTTLTGLFPDSEYEVAVRALDASGSRSALSDPLAFITPPAGPAGPTKPTNLTATATPTTVTLKWTASTDDVGVVGYDVLMGSTKVATVTGTTATVSGLTPDTAYTFTVAARDTEGLTSPSSDPLAITTPRASDATSVKYAYALKGTSHLKTLTRGPVPLTGAFAAELTVATGAFTGDLTLNNTRARLIALGLVPVTADLAFVMTSKTTGKLEGGAATATARFKVRLPKLYLFGSIPIAGGASCQTKTASAANLASEGTFNPLTGGRLQGTYALSDLTGCGALTSFISPLTKGTGNTIDIALTPQA